MGPRIDIRPDPHSGPRRPRRGFRPVAAGFRAAGIVALLVVSAACGGGKKQKQLPSSEVLFLEAQAKMANKKYYRAQELLNSVINHPSTEAAILADAQLMLADAYFFQKGFLNLTEAQSRYQTFLTFHPRHERADYAQFQLAMCLFLQVLEPDRDQNLTRRAIAEFRKVEDLYPGSQYVGQAAEKIGECWERLAEHTYLVGRFYMKRNAPKAAISRFTEVLEEYPEYRGREKVYFALARAYERDGQPEKAREFLSLLLLDFPDGEYAGRARKSLRRLQRSSGAAANRSKPFLRAHRRSAPSPMEFHPDVPAKPILPARG